jgi:hypothetical protein
MPTIYTNSFQFIYNLFKTVLFRDAVRRYFAYGIVSDVVALVPNLAILIASPSFRGVVFSPFELESTLIRQEEND